MGEEYPSPDNRYALILGCNEVRMSHWICSPELIDRTNDRRLFSAGSMWDAGNIRWSDDSRTLSFYMRKYPGYPQYDHEVVIRLDEEVAEVAKHGEEMRVIKLRELSGLFL